MRSDAPTQAYRPSEMDTYLQVIHALMLRDMRTRFGGKHIGWIIPIMFPVIHMLVLGTALTVKNVPCPMGDSILLFIATGAVPVLGFKYISREVMRGLSSNKPLTYYPQVKKIDVIFARIFIEITGSFAGLAAVFSILLVLGFDPFPVDPIMALCGYLTALFLGIGIGFVNIGISSIFPGWSTGYMFFAIALYICSGVVFMPCYLPADIYYILKFNPLVQIVEWVRLGYEPTLPIKVDYLYVLMFAGCVLMAGLLFERLFVRHKAL